MGVKSTHKDYDKLAPRWKRCRDVICGQDAMQAAGEAYLPRLKDESDPDYKARIKRSDFFNGTWRTIDALGGMAFRKPPTIDVPASIEKYLGDIDLAGMTMESLAKEVVEEVLSVERIGILVDHPPAKADENGKVVPITQAVAEAMGQRPTLQLYPTESIINWSFTRINNAYALSMVVLKECVEVPKDEFTSDEEDRYRVLDLDESGFYRQRVFKVDDAGKDILLEGPLYPLMSNKPLTFIPFKWVGTAGTNEKLDEPPLIDLVDKNVAHYQVNSDYRHGLHFTGLPTLFLAGMNAEVDANGNSRQYYIGSSAAIQSAHPDAKATFIEFTGQGLGAMENALGRLEQQMGRLGAVMIADQTQQVETATANILKRAGENSVLAKIVQSVSEALEWALTVFAEWAGQAETGIVYQINRDFLPAMMDAQTLTALFAGVLSGNISKREAFELLQRGDLIDPTKPYEEHQAEVEVDTPSPAVPAKVPPQQGAVA